jgi:DeoR/GlpR family transcriptional regulator of sugar metabolism/ABC-type sugar transport system substrate-binding protein
MSAVEERRQLILASLKKQGFLSVKQLSELCQVSDMTIRRDLEYLEVNNLAQRAFGGAVSLPAAEHSLEESAGKDAVRPESSLVERLDVLVATSVTPSFDRLLLERAGRSQVPIIAESLQLPNAQTVVAVDNFHAAQSLGRWAGEYAQLHWNAEPFVLDLTYYLANTQARSRGFLAGVREVFPDAERVLSLNAQSRFDAAYQLTRDALVVHPQINLIFAINDIVAWGAINACQDLNLDPDSLIVLPFGLEGNTLKKALQAGKFCRAGLAMFPELVGPTCVEASIAAYNQVALPAELITPHAVLTTENLTDWYVHNGSGWRLRPEIVQAGPGIPGEVDHFGERHGAAIPDCIGIIVPFMEHEWYQNLVAEMQAHAARYHIKVEIVDVDQSLKDEVELSRREIAHTAANLAEKGDVILIDGGPMATYLAEALLEKQGLTVITNAMPVFDILRAQSEIILISTGGAYRTSSQMLVGPTAEGALRELRADKLFLQVAGITFDFGLSHTHISEVTMKQAMIRSARQVILLADHTLFQQESTVQVAPLTVVHQLITDDGLPASTRLDLSKLGLQIILANV